ncbi:MAG TPA: hypothetical protein VK907_01225, partial [Phnomibacter sp.]|nr:hypothetical protein [Phnomibacter sp.]
MIAKQWPIYTISLVGTFETVFLPLLKKRGLSPGKPQNLIMGWIIFIIGTVGWHIGMYGMFKKAGIDPWKALVP